MVHLRAGSGDLEQTRGSQNAEGGQDRGCGGGPGGSGALVAVEERDGAAAGAVADRADGGRGDDEHGHRPGVGDAYRQGGPLAAALRGGGDQGDREGASPGWQPRGPVPEGAGGAEDGDHPPDDAGETAGRDALVVPVDGESGGHHAQLREHGVAVGGTEAPSVAHLQGEHGSALRGKAARRCGAVP